MYVCYSCGEVMPYVLVCTLVWPRSSSRRVQAAVLPRDCRLLVLHKVLAASSVLEYGTEFASVLVLRLLGEAAIGGHAFFLQCLADGGVRHGLMVGRELEPEALLRELLPACGDVLGHVQSRPGKRRTLQKKDWGRTLTRQWAQFFFVPAHRPDLP